MSCLAGPVEKIFGHACDVIVDACCIKLGSEGMESGGAKEMAIELVQRKLKEWRDSSSGRESMSRGDIKDVFQSLLQAAVDMLESVDSATWDMDVFNQELN